MRKILNITIILVSIVSSNFALSMESNKLRELQTRYPQASPFEILKKGFEESRDSISISDLSDQELLENCAIIKKSKTEDVNALTLEDASLGVFTSKKMLSPEIPAQPERGPLFPATPAIPATYAKKLFTEFYLGKFPQDQVLSQVGDKYDKYYDYISSEFKTEELSFNLIKPKELKFTNQFRKSGNLLFAKFHYIRPEGTETLGYGYCWHKDAKN